MQTVDKVSVTELIEKEGLKNLTPDVDTDHKYITIPDVNRPALQLAGFFDQFDSERVQIIGNVETAYLMTFDAPERRAKYAALSKYPIPAAAVDAYDHGAGGDDHQLAEGSDGTDDFCARRARRCIW